MAQVIGQRSNSVINCVHLRILSCYITSYFFSCAAPFAGQTQWVSE